MLFGSSKTLHDFCKFDWSHLCPKKSSYVCAEVQMGGVLDIGRYNVDCPCSGFILLPAQLLTSLVDSF